jgi:hypothetical protein
MEWIYIEETLSPMGYKDLFLITTEGDLLSFCFCFYHLMIMKNFTSTPPCVALQTNIKFWQDEGYETH